MYIRVFFKGTANTRIYTYCHTLARQDALPIYQGEMAGKVAALAIDPDGPPLSEKLNESARAKYVSAMAQAGVPWQAFERFKPWTAGITLAISPLDRKSTRLNSSH